MKETFIRLYEDFVKGTRTQNGQMVIDGAEHDDYEALYFHFLEELKPVFRGDFYGWYAKQVRSYVKYRKRYDRFSDVYCPQEVLPVHDHSVRQVLAVFKYYIYRRATNGKSF